MRIAEAGGVGAPVLAKFNNGLVYGFTAGEIINPDVIPHTDHIQRYRYFRQNRHRLKLHKWTFAFKTMGIHCVSAYYKVHGQSLPGLHSERSYECLKK